MKLTAAEYRDIAKDSLRGNWGKAVAATLLAAGFGAFCTSAHFIVLFLAGMGVSMAVFEGIPHFFLWILLGGTALALFYFFVGGTARFGFIDFNLALLDRREASPAMVVRHLGQMWRAVYMKLALFSCEFFLTLLFVVPGVIAIHSYAMVPYILEEKPEYSVGKAMRMSKKIMRGNRWQLFCLRVSFLGWYLLGILSLGLGFFYMLPYLHASEAVFYNEISGRADAYYGRK